MAWRIDEAVVKGEIDNRERDRVRGRIWFIGRNDPVVLDLKGNAWRDVAGRVLYFENPTPKAMDLDGLAEAQDGAVGCKAEINLGRNCRGLGHFGDSGASIPADQCSIS